MKKSEYVLQSGTHQVNVDGVWVSFIMGDVVELTDAQYEAFRDKFKPKAIVEAEHKLAQVQEATDSKAKVPAK